MSKYKFGDLVELKRGGEWQLGVVTSVENCDGFKLYVVALKNDNGRQLHVAELELRKAAENAGNYVLRHVDDEHTNSIEI